MIFWTLALERHWDNVQSVVMQHRPIANMAAATRKRGFSVVTVAKGQSVSVSFVDVSEFYATVACVVSLQIELSL